MRHSFDDPRQASFDGVVLFPVELLRCGLGNRGDGIVIEKFFFHDLFWGHLGEGGTTTGLLGVSGDRFRSQSSGNFGCLLRRSFTREEGAI